MNVAAQVRAQIQQLVADGLNRAKAAGELSLGRDVTPADIQVERPKDRAHGDWATNAAMVLAREARTAPRQIAEAVVRHLEARGTFVERAEVAGPGFINFYLKDEWLAAALRGILSAGPEFGKVNVGRGQRVLVEFVSANPTGPLNVVSARHATVGDVLAEVLAWAGFEVDREFYVNDAGNQVRMLGAAMDVRVRQLLGENAELPEGAYPGEYLVDIAREYISQHGADDRPQGPPPWAGDGATEPARTPSADVEGDDEEPAAPARKWRHDPAYEAWLHRLARFAVERIVDGQKAVLRGYRVEFDRWFHESEVRAARGPETVVARLREAGHAYEADGAVWIRSTAFGDDKDRVLVKRDGNFTYIVPDVAYHVNKFERGYDHLINLLGRDHYGYHVRLKAALAALGFNPDALEIIYLQMVHLVRGGQEVRMSKRRGEFVAMSDFLKEVSVDAARWFFLMRSTDSELDFDLDLANLQTSDNPVYYVQYAHARICSIFRQAEAAGFAVEQVLDNAPLERLVEEPERELVRKLAEFPDEVELAAVRREPHRLTRYAHEVASGFHSFYTHCRVLGEDPDLSGARLALCAATRQVLANALAIMGINAPEEM